MVTLYRGGGTLKGERGVDLLPNGKYVVYQMMFYQMCIVILKKKRGSLPNVTVFFYQMAIVGYRM